MDHSSRLVAADQLLVSGCNFLFVLLIGRVFAPEFFGAWVLWNAVLLYLNASSSAFVITPLATLVPQRSDQSGRMGLVEGALGIQLLWCGGCAALLYGGASAVRALEWNAGFLPSPFAVVAAQVGLQMQDWVRRTFYTLRVLTVPCAIDLIAYGGQLLGSVYLVQRGHATLDEVFTVSAIAFGASFAVGAGYLKARPRIGNLRGEAVEFFSLGRAYFMAGQLQWVGAQAGFFVASSYLGAASAGALRAVQTVLSPITVLYQALDNSVPIKAASIYSTDGAGAVRVYLKRVGLKVGAFVLLYVLFVALAASPLLGFLFGKYEDRQLLAALNGAALLAALFWRLGIYRRRAERDVKGVLLSNLVWAASTVLAALILVQRMGEVGVMLGALISTTLAAAVLAFGGQKAIRNVS